MFHPVKWLTNKICHNNKQLSGDKCYQILKTIEQFIHKTLMKFQGNQHWKGKAKQNLAQVINHLPV